MESKVIFCDLVFEKTQPDPNIDPLFKNVKGNKLIIDSAEFGYLRNEEFKERFNRFVKAVSKYKASGKVGYSILYGEVIELELQNGEIVKKKDLTPGEA